LTVAGSSSAARAEQQKICQLCFAPADSAVFHYKISNYVDQNFRGSSAQLTQSSEVDLICRGRDEAGDTKVDLHFKKLTSSLVSNNQLMEWEPPYDLEGKTIRAVVSRKGKVIEVKALQNIPGIGGEDEMRDIVEPWFVRLPDSSFAVGSTWTREIREGVKEDASKEPDRVGQGLYTLKKLEKKGGVEVALIEARINARLNEDTPAGLLVGTEKTEIKASIVLGSGHIIEIKRVVEIKGDIIARDELTNKETKQKTAVVSTYEGKLQD
jgi:hypothetical protein